MTEARGLDNQIIALSMSPSADLKRLGYAKEEFDRLVFEFAMRIIRANGRILYGGHLKPDSLTVQIYEHVAAAYAHGLQEPKTDGTRPILHLLPFIEFARTPFSRLIEVLRWSGSFAETKIVVDTERLMRLTSTSEGLMLWPSDVSGERICLNQPEDLARHLEGPLPTDKESLSAMRKVAEKYVKARIVFGGKRGDLGVSGGLDCYHGKMPGIFEEAIGSLEAGLPTVFLAAYGGAARDAAIDLGLFPRNEATPFLGDTQQGYEEARAQLQELGRRLDPSHLEQLEGFARRDDTELLARDVVRWLSDRPAPTGR